MKNNTISREELAEKLRQGAERKMTEREAYAMKAFEDPDRAPHYLDLMDWLQLDIRYHQLASAYYSNDFDSVDNGYDEDLLALVEASRISPKLYASYLRDLNPEDRAEEKVTHAAVEGLKKAIRDTVVPLDP